MRQTQMLVVNVKIHPFVSKAPGMRNSLVVVVYGWCADASRFLDYQSGLFFLTPNAVRVSRKSFLVQNSLGSTYRQV